MTGAAFYSIVPVRPLIQQQRSLPLLLCDTDCSFCLMQAEACGRVYQRDGWRGAGAAGAARATWAAARCPGWGRNHQEQQPHHHTRDVSVLPLFHQWNSVLCIVLIYEVQEYFVHCILYRMTRNVSR